VLLQDYSLLLEQFFFKIDNFSLPKLFAVLISLLGVIFVGIEDKSDNGAQNTLIGDAISLFAAIMFGVYILFLKIKVGNEERIRMPIFFWIFRYS